MKKALLLILSAALVATIFQTAQAASPPQPVHAGTRILHSGGLVVEVGDPDSPIVAGTRGCVFHLWPT